MFDIIFYKDKDGNEPIKDYIYELAKKGLTSKNERIQAKRNLAEYLERSEKNENDK
jgi:hypothetical protein